MRKDKYGQSIDTVIACREGIIANDPQLLEYISRIQNGENEKKLWKEFQERNRDKDKDNE